MFAFVSTFWEGNCEILKQHVQETDKHIEQWWKHNNTITWWIEHNRNEMVEKILFYETFCTFSMDTRKFQFPDTKSEHI